MLRKNSGACAIYLSVIEITSIKNVHAVSHCEKKRVRVSRENLWGGNSYYIA